MNFSNCLFTVRASLVLFGMMALFPAAASAQGVAGGSPRPYQGLFGRSTASATASQVLNFTVALDEGYNDDSSPQLGAFVDPTSGPTAGLQTMLTANASYGWRGRTNQFAFNSLSAVAYYNELSKTRSLSHTVGLGFTARLSEKTSFLINQGAAFSPSYLYGLFPSESAVNPGDHIPSAPDYSASTRDTYTYDSSLTMMHNLTRRNRISATADFRYTDYAFESETQRDLRVGGFIGQFSRNIKRSLALSLGYRYRTGDVGFGFEPTTEHGIDATVDYSRPLSATRRAFLALRVGSSAVELPPSMQTLLSAGGRRYQIDTEGSAGYEFSQGWGVRGLFRRGIEYVPTLTAPVFTTGVGANLDGMPMRRLRVTASAAYSNGASIFDRDGAGFTTYTATTRFQYALNRKLAAYAQYLYYFYDFRENRQLAPGMVPYLERNAVRAGFTVWVPVLER
jgi:hypothetical protein